MADELVALVVDEGLGNTSYLVDVGDGRALVVDPSRDLRMLRAVTEASGLAVAFAADTHLHADFLTGSCQLAASDNAMVLASAAGDRGYSHRALHDGDEVDLGGLRLQALATPGHTDEHVSFLLLDGDKPLGVFTGGSLLVGAAARTDLLGPDRAADLARSQFNSLRRLMRLPDEVAVWPTHGAGSFCSAPPGAERTSTIGEQRATNPLLQLTDEDQFVTTLLGSLGSYPPYFDRLGEINRRGPTLILDGMELASFTADQVARLAASDEVIVDVRAITDFAQAHIPGSVSIELRDAFATWLGWLVPFGTAPIIVRDDSQDVSEVLWQAAKIGYELRGELAGGIQAWLASGQPTMSTELATPSQLPPASALDIRQASEFAAGHVAGATHLELGDILINPGVLPDAPYVVMCGHGERAMSAASLIEREGLPAPAVVLGGPAEWAMAHQLDLETGT